MATVTLPVTIDTIYLARIKAAYNKPGLSNAEIGALALADIKRLFAAHIKGLEENNAMAAIPPITEIPIT